MDIQAVKPIVNSSTTLLASAARTTTQTSADLYNPYAQGIKVTVDVTTAGTGSITCTINFKDPASGKYVNLLTGAAITTAVTNTYTIFPGATVTANVSANDQLPLVFQIVITANNANTITYSVGYNLLG